MIARRIQWVALGALLLLGTGLAAAPQKAAKHQNEVIDLWMAGKPAFGIYVPNSAFTVEGATKLAENPLYDFLFLNLEGRYDPEAVRAVAKGLRSPTAVNRKMILVRIPPISKDGAAAAKARVKEVFDAGGDGITLPHIRSVDEAKEAIEFFKAAKADVWSPKNPKGEKIAMLMVEDPDAVAASGKIADLKGISILACGIGSLRGAIQGTPEQKTAGAEAGTQKVLGETKRTRLANMLTAGTRDIEQRVKEGFLALLMQGASADDTIKLGRAAAGR